MRLGAAIGVLVALVLAMPARGDGARGSGGANPAAENDACTSCHSEIASEWSTSLHRSSYRDTSFQRGFAIERLPSCRRCHAPEADLRAVQAEGWSADHGVACTTCHGTIVKAHDPSRHAALGTTLCAGCHEFGFVEHDADPEAPKKAVRNRMMQRTASEHAASPYAGESCASCHLPKVGEGASRHASHRFGVTRDESALRAALAVSARREPRAVVVELVPRDVGHAFPTGDMFRRIRLDVEIGPEGAPVARFERRLARTFGIEDGRKVEIGDARLVGPTTFTFPLADRVARLPIRYRVAYQRLTIAAMSPTQSRGPEQIEQEIVLASGAVR